MSYDPKTDSRVSCLTAYYDGYQDAQYNRPVKWSGYLGTRLSYLIGYKQHLQDHADAIERDIIQTEREGKEVFKD